MRYTQLDVLQKANSLWFTRIKYLTKDDKHD